MSDAYVEYFSLKVSSLGCQWTFFSSLLIICLTDIPGMFHTFLFLITITLYDSMTVFILFPDISIFCLSIMLKYTLNYLSHQHPRSERYRLWALYFAEPFPILKSQSDNHIYFLFSLKFWPQSTNHGWRTTRTVSWTTILECEVFFTQPTCLTAHTAIMISSSRREIIRLSSTQTNVWLLQKGTGAV